MDINRKNDDCYFYYYSSCMKGEACPFRHEPTALGIETVCNFWKQGNCYKPHCNFRHMEVRKNRTLIPCYWESQPTGCRKPHCTFLHVRPGREQSTPQDLILPVGSASTPGETPADGIESSSLEPETTTNFVSSPAVDPLVVNFEEESDSESVPSCTPVKRSLHVKTLEEIRLEKILQAEQEAFYQLEPSDSFEEEPRPSLQSRLGASQPQQDSGSEESDEEETRRLLLLELHARRRQQQQQQQQQQIQSRPSVMARLGNKAPSPPSPRKRPRSPIVFDLPEAKRKPVQPPVKSTARSAIIFDLADSKSIVEPQTLRVTRVRSPIVFSHGDSNQSTSSVELDSKVHKSKKSKRSEIGAPSEKSGIKRTVTRLDLSAPKPEKVRSLEGKRRLLTEVKKHVLSSKKEESKSVSKPVVAVAGRKRPHSEDSAASATEQKPRRPALKLWRSSRLEARLEETKQREEPPPPAPEPTPFLRRLQLRKAAARPAVSEEITSSSEDVNNCAVQEDCQNGGPATDHPLTPVLPSTPRTLLIKTSTSTPSLDLSLLSPTSGVAENVFGESEDILQDIDDLLND